MIECLLNIEDLQIISNILNISEKTIPWLENYNKFSFENMRWKNKYIYKIADEYLLESVISKDWIKFEYFLQRCTNRETLHAAIVMAIAISKIDDNTEIVDKIKDIANIEADIETNFPKYNEYLQVFEDGIYSLNNDITKSPEITRIFVIWMCTNEIFWKNNISYVFFRHSLLIITNLALKTNELNACINYLTLIISVKIEENDFKNIKYLFEEYYEMLANNQQINIDHIRFCFMEIAKNRLSFYNNLVDKNNTIKRKINYYENFIKISTKPNDTEFFKTVDWKDFFQFKECIDDYFFADFKTCAKMLEFYPGEESELLNVFSWVDREEQRKTLLEITIRKYKNPENLIEVVCDNGYFEGIDILISEGVDKNKIFEKVCNMNGNPMIKFLLEKGVNPAYGIQNACYSKNNSSTIKHLLRVGASFNGKFDNAFVNQHAIIYNEDCGNAFQNAFENVCRDNKLDYIEIFIAAGADPNTGLLSTCLHGKLETLQFLIEKGADLEKAIVEASKHSSIAFTEFLIDKGVNVNKCIFEACLFDRKDIIEYLFNKEADIKEIIENARKFNSKNITEFLLSRGIVS